MRLDEYCENYKNYITFDTVLNVIGDNGLHFLYGFENKNKYDVIEIFMIEGEDVALIVEENEVAERPHACNEQVNHPQHYQGKIEVIDFIEDKDLNFNLGNAVKYIARAGKKDPNAYIEDLKKAIWYLEREVGKND